METKISKRLLIAVPLLAILLVAACQAAPLATPTIAPTDTPSGPDPVTLAQDLLAALNSGDVDTAVSYLSDDAMFALGIRIHRHLHEEPTVGKEAVRTYWEGDSWKAVTVDGSEFAAQEGEVLYTCKIYAKDVLVGSGSALSNNACVIVVKDGMIIFIGDQSTELLYFNK
jgi:hypothetical protein